MECRVQEHELQVENRVRQNIARVIFCVKMVEESKYPGDTVVAVELRMKFFFWYTDRNECQAAVNELRAPFSAQFGQVS